MKKSAMLLTLILTASVCISPVYASDWDKAGKALTIIEGMRILTGGKVDIVGNITGINKPQYATAARYVPARPARHHRVRKVKVWVPHYEWRSEYVPRPQCGKMIVEGHYVTYKVESGGHWEWQEDHYRDYSYYR